MMNSGIFKRVYFDFYVYQVFRERESGDAFVKTFLVTASGHLLAKEIAGEHEHSFNPRIERNELTTYFRCSKRVGAMSSDAEPGRCDYKGIAPLTRQQVAYFEQHRQMNA